MILNTIPPVTWDAENKKIKTANFQVQRIDYSKKFMPQAICSQCVQQVIKINGV
jgi:hypothetical protein